MLLEKIEQSSDIKKLKAEDYPVLAQEIRQFLLEKISRTGGHLASNLGVVELTMALHLAFDLPKDKIIWDVGHQAYTHKILSGRKDGFDDLRQFGGMSGFPKRKESPYDAFDTGHSSTSISAGLGIAQAREILGEDYSVISIIGDGALTGGMAYEALNNAAQLKKNFIIVLNDNEMSISKNVGGMSRYLSNVRTREGYADLKLKVERTLRSVPVIGKAMVNGLFLAKNGIKQFFSAGDAVRGHGDHLPGACGRPQCGGNGPGLKGGQAGPPCGPGPCGDHQGKGLRPGGAEPLPVPWSGPL